MNNQIKNIKGIKRARKAKALKSEATCVLTIATTKVNSDAHKERIEELRSRLDRVKSEANKRGYRFVKTEWATCLIEDELTKLEKRFGI